MPLRTPSSRASLNLGVSPVDAVCALGAPVLALIVRDARIVTSGQLDEVAFYCLVSLVCTLVAFIAFRIRDGIATFFSVQDAVDVIKAVIVAEVFVVTVLFTVTRLEGVPRSTPIIHALLLMTALLGVRTIARFMHFRKNQAPASDKPKEHILVVGAGQLSLLFIKLLDAYRPGCHEVFGILDDRPETIGRKVGGVPIIGRLRDLQVLMDEYAVHGIQTDRVVIAGDRNLFEEEELSWAQNVCDKFAIPLDFFPDLVGIRVPYPNVLCRIPEELNRATSFQLPAYFKYKSVADTCTAFACLIVFAPLLALAALLVLIDLGTPVLFWQQRIGRGGQKFLLHKFRTLRPPFDACGAPIAHEDRISATGRFLRKTRLDELPQLFNVLVGEMAIIGPRPLLPEDQPSDPEVRLRVRPGITGWAQVNGGKLLSPEEKDRLDEWYVRNAAPSIDLRILLATVRVVVFGERRATGSPVIPFKQAVHQELSPAEHYKRAG